MDDAWNDALSRSLSRPRNEAFRRRVMAERSGAVSDEINGALDSALASAPNSSPLALGIA